MNTALPLAGLSVLVTRPAHQAEPLCAMIENAGGRALRFPALAIAGPSDPDRVRAVGTELATVDLAIFVSPNAVRGVASGIGCPLPRDLAVAAIGPATAAALADLGYDDVICPDSGFDSESLLSLPALESVAGKRIVIFRGDGGRGLLGGTLTARGAEVRYVEVYRRGLPAPPTGEVAAALRDRRVDAVVVTSAQALENLVTLCGDELAGGLYAAQLVVSSARMIEKAESLGFATPLIAGEASDHAMIEALVTWRTGGPPEGIG